jgi:hypothetical protein
VARPAEPHIASGRASADRGHAGRPKVNVKDLELMGQVVIASRLSDGVVVFLSEPVGTDAVEWVTQLEGALVSADDARAGELLSLAEADAGERHEIVDPYLIDVEEEDGKLRPTKYREAIRCLGPTIRPDLGKQAEAENA